MHYSIIIFAIPTLGRDGTGSEQINKQTHQLLAVVGVLFLFRAFFWLSYIDSIYVLY